MKRIIALFALVCILLCGCAGGTTIKEEKALSELGEGTREESVAIVKVTINPEFELYLDGAFCVIKVRCLNEDAVTAFETMQTDGISVIGLRYEEAMPVILDGIASVGFLTEGTDKIKVETTTLAAFNEEELAALAESFSAPVEYYTAERQLNAVVEAPAPKPAQKEQSSKGNIKKNNANPDLANYEFSTDLVENGEVVGTRTNYYDAEGYYSRQHNAYLDGTYYTEYYTYTDGYRSQVYTEYSEGSDFVYYITEFDSNGNTVRTEYQLADGYCLEMFFDENGEVIEVIEERHSDGVPVDNQPWNQGEPNSVVEQKMHYDSGEGVCTDYFDENGLLYKRIEVYADGTSYERTFYPNGDTRSMKFISSNGVCEAYQYYDESGTVISNIGEPNLIVNYITDTGTGTHYFDENGLLDKSIEVDENGRLYERTFYPSGELRSAKHVDPNGVCDGYSYYDESGTYIFNIGEPNLIVTYITTGGVQTDYFDENGLLYKVCEVYYDGTSRVRLYDENGEMVAEAFFDENGNIMDMRNSGT